jgi:hypothetical protein
VLYNVLKHKKKNGEKYPKLIISLCRWLHDQVVAVLGRLIVHKLTPCTRFLPNAQDWKTVSKLHILSKLFGLTVEILLDWMLLQHATDPTSTKISSVNA